MEIIKCEITSFPVSEDGKKCAQLYFKKLLSNNVEKANIVSDEQGYHVSGLYHLFINEQKMMKETNLNE